jgi:hypothetical protein
VWSIELWDVRCHGSHSARPLHAIQCSVHTDGGALCVAPQVRWLQPRHVNATLSEHALRRRNGAVKQFSPGMTMQAASRYAHRLDGALGCNLSAQVAALPDRLGATWGCVGDDR